MNITLNYVTGRQYPDLRHAQRAAQDLSRMQVDELLRFVDRSHPEVRILAERLETTLQAQAV